MAPILTALVKGGLSLLGNAFLVKGKEWVEEKTGVKLEASMPPETLEKLRQWELENEVELQKIQLENNKLAATLEQSYLLDTQDARKRDTAFGQAGRRNERADNLAYLAVGGFLGVVLLLFVAPAVFGFKLDQDTKEILLYILGVLQTLVVGVFNFEFGTSKGEQKQANAMTKWLDESGSGESK